MMDAFKKVFLAGVGALSLSRDKAKKIVEELISQGKIKEQEGRQLAEEMLKKANDTRHALEEKIRDRAEQMFSKLNVKTQEQLKKMEIRIHELEQKLAEKGGPSKPSTAGAKTAKKRAQPTKRKVE